MLFINAADYGVPVLVATLSLVVYFIFVISESINISIVDCTAITVL
jgi:hypothetical protein